jgi:hypothetical protein
MKKLRQVRFNKSGGQKKIIYEEKFVFIRDGKKIEITNLNPEPIYISIDDN